MDVEFSDKDLDRLEIDGQFTANLSQALVKAYRKKIQAIRAASDERDFYKQRSFNFEELQGKRKGQYSIRLNDQYRLVFKFLTGNPEPGVKTVVIMCIEDYH
jgi:toxin HigB-1